MLWCFPRLRRPRITFDNTWLNGFVRFFLPKLNCSLGLTTNFLSGTVSIPDIRPHSIWERKISVKNQESRGKNSHFRSKKSSIRPGPFTGLKMMQKFTHYQKGEMMLVVFSLQPSHESFWLKYFQALKLYAKF